MYLDLIRAYKGLQKEKDALEASVKILSSSSRKDDQDGKEQGETEGVEGSGVRYYKGTFGVKNILRYLSIR